jgi:hypothetical protein
MTIFLRLLSDKDKQASLLAAIRGDRGHVFDVNPTSFRQIPGAPFAYWVNEAVRRVFQRLPPFEDEAAILRVARRGVNSNDDYRFLRCCWEVKSVRERWVNHPKGGAYSPFYADIHLVLDWFQNGTYLEVKRETSKVYSFAIVPSKELYRRPGLTWPRRTSSGISMRAMPAGCIFADKGPAAFVDNDHTYDLLALLAISNSRPFSILVELQLAAADAAARSYEVGVIQKTPIPFLNTERSQQLATLALRAWVLKRTLDTITETSHAFLLPFALRTRIGDYDPPGIETELIQIQAKNDAIAFDLYGFSEADRQIEHVATTDSDELDSADDDDGEAELELSSTDALFSWAVGVALGRFDWRLATGEREIPTEPGPFDPLPAKSPGMLPDGAEPFHAHAGILVDDPGHRHDLVHLIEEVLGRVDMPVPDDVRRWLQRDFFVFHLQRYSKSRRKAPIYWPLATASGSYTLWIYYPSLSSQTLYSAINDFVEPKLKDVSADVATLRNKGAARTAENEKQFESFQAFELELIELRDTLLSLAPTYKPNHDDGVQITAAPLWPLFRHKPWQKILKDTWAKLEKGDYDWAHLALNYWPERAREKCKTDKSLAIAHGLEALYIEPEAKPKKTRSKKVTGT